MIRFSLRLPVLLAPLLVLGLGGCVAKAAFDVVTLPVRAAGKAVDLATTSQSEADENRGREIRRREERLAKLEKDWEKRDRQCRSGDDDACEKRDEISAEMDELRPTIPSEPGG